jgi:hypothetical protein
MTTHPGNTKGFEPPHLRHPLGVLQLADYLYPSLVGGPARGGGFGPHEQQALAYSAGVGSCTRARARVICALQLSRDGRAGGCKY